MDVSQQNQDGKEKPDRTPMSNGQVDILITCVESKKGIWKTTDKAYKSSKKIKESWWEDIGKVVKCSGQKCATKWKNLLKDFRADLRNQLKASSGDAASSYVPTCRWYNRMQFLIETQAPGESTGNFAGLFDKNTKNTNEQAKADEAMNFDEDEDSDSGLFDIAAMLSIPSTSTSVNPVAKSSTVKENKSVVQIEEHEHYFRSIVPRISHLSEEQLILFKGQVSDIIVKFAFHNTDIDKKRNMN